MISQQNADKNNCFWNYSHLHCLLFQLVNETVSWMNNRSTESPCLMQLLILKISRISQNCITHCQFSGFSFIPFFCLFSSQKLCSSNFFVKLQHTLLDLCHLTSFFKIVLLIDLFCDFNSNFLLEAGQILERSQWIQIL